MTSTDLLEAGARHAAPSWLPLAALAGLALLALIVLVAHRPPTVPGHGTLVVTVPQQYQPLPGRFLS